MERFLRKLWVVIFAFMIFGMLAWIPVDKYQKSYMKHYHKIKQRPQEHVDQAYKYADYIENGGAPNKFQLHPEDFLKKNRTVKKIQPNKRKPYYIRDKHNPNILYPYQG